jgi:hypothetical protein
MSKRSGDRRQGLPTAEFCPEVVFQTPSASYALSASEVRALPFRFAAWIVVVLLLSRLDFAALGQAFRDVLLNTAMWDRLFMRIDIDEVVLFAATRPAGVLRTVVPGVGAEVASMFVALVTFVLVVGRTSPELPADKRAREMAFRLRQACRSTSLHYSCDQFWLRIRGR